jgi:hypothetical protein
MWEVPRRVNDTNTGPPSHTALQFHFQTGESHEVIIALAAIIVFSLSVSRFLAIALEAAQIAAREVETSSVARTAHERRLNGILPDFNA